MGSTVNMGFGARQKFLSLNPAGPLSVRVTLKE